MTSDAHLNSLQERHAQLQTKIDEAAQHPSTDPLEVQSMKRKKLQLKEEIERIKS